MKDSLPKIVFNDECIDLRNNPDQKIFPKSNKNGLKSSCTKKCSPSKIKESKNKVVNNALKKLAKFYTSNNRPVVEISIENSLYDPYSKKISNQIDGRSLKSKSELSTVLRKENKSQNLSPSSPTVQSSYEKNVSAVKIEPFKNRFTMTKPKDDAKKDGKSLIRDKSIEYLIKQVVDKKPSQLNTQTNNNYQWKDQRLAEKYSLLKVPWKRSQTLPTFSKPFLVKEDNDKKFESFDKKTYLYDDGSEVDSTYIEQNRKQYFSYALQNQFLAILSICGIACGLLLISLILWFISGNKFIYKLIIPKTPEHKLKRYIKYAGGGVVYVVTTFIKAVGRIFAIPTQQVYHPAPEFSWPPMHNLN